MSGTFQLANQARTFAGNNANPLTEVDIEVIRGTAYNFDGGNQGFVTGTATNGVCTVLGYSGTILVSTTAGAGLDYYVGAMVRYNASGGSSPAALVSGNTYFIASIASTATPDQYRITLKNLPTDAAIFTPTGGTATTETFTKIGVSIDRDIIHIPNSNFTVKDLIEYSFPAGVGGRFAASSAAEEKLFYFVEVAYDSHNYKLTEKIGFNPVVATGGTTTTIYDQGRTWRVHTFTSGTSTFAVSDVGTDGLVEYLVVGGGGGGGPWGGGGGGGGGVRSSVQGWSSGRGTAAESRFTVTATNYSVVVGAGGGRVYNSGAPANGGQSSFGSIIALGGGGGGGRINDGGVTWGNAGNGGSGGGATWIYAGSNGVAGTGTTAQGFSGGTNTWVNQGNHASGGGGGSGQIGETPANADDNSGNGGNGTLVNINGRPLYWGGGGGGALHFNTHSGSGGLGGGGGGTGGGSAGYGGSNALNNGLRGANTVGNVSNVGGDAGANTGGGGGAGGGAGANNGGLGGSGIVIIRYPLTGPVSGDYISATGGTITTVPVNGINYREHRFTTVGTTNFVVTAASTVSENNRIQYIVVAGGGGGGTDNSGGGGGGGVVIDNGLVSVGTYPAVVGVGGPVNTNGGNSTFFGKTALGGGYGGSTSAGFPGGSGGGAGRDTAGAGGAATQPSSASGGFGNPGGGGNNGTSYGGGGGGGGAGAPGGVNGISGPAGSGGNPGDYWAGNGGDGIVWIDGNFYGGGGGGGAFQLQPTLRTRSGQGGRGGGGTGGISVDGRAGYNTGFTRDATVGTDGTGGGGGGNLGYNTVLSTSSKRGGSGIVIVRYPIGPVV
jgi:hypothetical protein